MAKTPNHMSGIDALPRVSSWQQSRLDAEADRGLYGGNRYVNGQWVTANGQPVTRPAKPPNPFGKNGTLSQQIAKSLKENAPKAVLDNINQIKRAKTLVAVADDSECFSDLRYSAKDGGVYATFRRDGTEYFYPMDRTDALEWFADSSLGGFFNAEIR